MSDGSSGAAGELVALLASLRLTVATAEATTGGLIGHLLVAVPGSSAAFRGGIAPYSNQAKIRLGAPEAVLAEFGAVSKETAEALATAAMNWFGAEIGIAETGIAGPGGGNDTRPVGSSWVAVSTDDGAVCREFVFEGDRVANQESVAEAALRLAIEVVGRQAKA